MEIKKPFEKGYCDDCLFSYGDEMHCSLLKVHCGAVIECNKYKYKKENEK